MNVSPPKLTRAQLLGAPLAALATATTFTAARAILRDQMAAFIYRYVTTVR